MVKLEAKDHHVKQDQIYCQVLKITVLYKVYGHLSALTFFTENIQGSSIVNHKILRIFMAFQFLFTARRFVH